MPDHIQVQWFHASFTLTYCVGLSNAGQSKNVIPFRYIKIEHVEKDKSLIAGERNIDENDVICVAIKQ